MAKAKTHNKKSNKNLKGGVRAGAGAPPVYLKKANKALNSKEAFEVFDMILQGDYADIKAFADQADAEVLAKGISPLKLIACRLFVKGVERADMYIFDRFLDRMFGRTPEAKTDLPEPSNVGTRVHKLTFIEFCVASDYPAPFDKQVEMKDFVICDDLARLLLGSRGYGKTDYAVIMGLAYQIYCEWFDQKPSLSSLLVTKSESRNTSMLNEIQKACEKQGVTFEKANATCLRVEGLIGKDHTVDSITLGSSGTRGRHPKLIIMDDPVTPEDTSAATRKRAVKLYEELHKLCGNIVIIGQPVHKLDLYGKLRGILKKLEVPHGSIPELDADLEAQRLAGVSEESIQASYMLQILTSDFAPFDKIKYVQKFEAGDCVAFIDPSFEGGDYTALTILRGYFDGIMIKGKVYKKAWNHCLEDMVDEMVRCGVRKLAFEVNSLGDQPIIMLRQLLPDGIGVMGKKSTANKHSRIMNAGAFAESIHLARDSDPEYIEQVVSYEYGVDHDDAPDSLASAMEWVGLVRGKMK